LVTTSAFATVSATSSVNNAFFSDLSLCDSKFFTTLGAQPGDFSASTHFRTNGTIGYFQVSDRRDQKLSIVRFSPSHFVGTLEIVGYFDELFSLGNQASMISWGFLVRAPIEQVVAITKPHIWDNNRLERDGPAYVRSELWDSKRSDIGWQKVTTASGQVPKAGTVERVLMIEPYENDSGLTRFGCSLQGSVTREMLRRDRPDLGL
jgi:hypothetical protein